MASLEAETIAWQTYRDVARAAKAAAYTAVADPSGVTFAGTPTATISPLTPNQSATAPNELKIDELFARPGCRPDYYSSVSTGGTITDAPFGYPKTKDIETAIETHELSGGGTNVPGSAATYMPKQRQMSALESFRKAYRQRIQQKQQLLTHKQFLATWTTQADQDFYTLLLNGRVHNNLT